VVCFQFYGDNGDIEEKFHGFRFFLGSLKLVLDEKVRRCTKLELCNMHLLCEFG
jgi:hypothetical protein